MVHVLYEGSFSVDASKAFVPFDARTDDPQDRRGSIFVHVHPFLIVAEDGLILCDTGLGFRQTDGGLLIHENIQRLGYEPEDVKYVLLSHLHKDHAGGMVDFRDGTARVAFPNAEYYVQRGEWEAAFAGDNPSYRTEIFDVVQRSGNLVLLDGDGAIDHRISYEMNGGHTPCHQAFHIRTGGEHYFFGGDVLPEPEDLVKNFIAKYDFDGRRARDLRKRYRQQGRDNDWTFLFYHSKGVAVGKIPLSPEGGTI